MSQKFSDLFHDTNVGSAALSLFVHSSDLLAPALREQFFVGVAKVDRFLSNYADPVILAARDAKYDPTVDDGWIAALTSKERLDAIAAGEVNFQKYMGKRYSDAMAKFMQNAAQAAYNAPEVVGFNKRAIYDIRKRLHYDETTPMYDQSGKQLGVTHDIYGSFLNKRQLDSRIDLPNSRLDRNTPWLILFRRHMENLGIQHAFQPGKMVDGRFTLDKESFMHDLYLTQVSETASEAEKKAAYTIQQTLRGEAPVGSMLNKALQAHTEATFINNIGVIWNHFSNTVLLRHVPLKTLNWGIQEVRNPSAGTIKLLKEARLLDTANVQRGMLNPYQLVKEPEGKDLMRYTDKIFRRATYLSAAKHFIESNQNAGNWQDVIQGTPKGLLARAYALSEVQGIYGSATKYSYRTGSRQLPGQFYLKNAHLAMFQRTVADMRADPKGTFLNNVLPRLVLNGAKGLTDADTMRLIRGVLPPEQWAPLIQGLTASENDQDPGVLHAADMAMGTNFSGRSSLADSKILPGLGALEGRSEPIDFSTTMRNLAKLNDPNVSDSQKLDAAADAGAFLSTFLPRGNAVTIGGVRVSTATLIKGAEAVKHNIEHQQGKATGYAGRPVPYKPIAEAASTLSGGFGQYGQVHKELAKNAVEDKGYIQHVYSADKHQFLLQHPGEPYQLPAYLNGFIDQYIQIHGGDKAAIKKQLKASFKSAQGAGREEINLQSEQVAASKKAGSPETAGQKTELNRMLNSWNSSHPGQHINRDHVLKYGTKAVKR